MALSKTKVDYIVASEAAKETIYLHWLAADFLDFDLKSETTPILTCDSQSTNTPHAESGLSCKDKAYRGAISSHPVAHNIEETRNLNDRYLVEHRQQPNESTTRWSLQNPNQTHGLRRRWQLNQEEKDNYPDNYRSWPKRNSNKINLKPHIEQRAEP